MKQAVNSYRSLMSDVDLPDHVRTSIMDAVACEHAVTGDQTAAHRPTPIVRERRKRPLARGLAVAACTVALVVGAAFASGIAHLPGTPSENDALRAVVPASGNYFVLSAYAAEQAEGGSDRSATLELRNFGLTGGWSSGDLDLETGEAHSDGDAPACVGDDDQMFAQVRYLLDLACTGNNIRSVTYSIGGERVHFTSENWIRGPYSDEPVDFEQQDSFTIAYDDQASDKASVQRNLVAYFPLNERAREIGAMLDDDFEKRQRIHEGAGIAGGENVSISSDDHPELLSDSERKALNDELGSIILRGYAELLAQAPLTLTATFADGTTQTKSYVIAPVDDFDRRLAAYHAELSKPAEEHSPALVEPVLYTITEIG